MRKRLEHLCLFLDGRILLLFKTKQGITQQTTPFPPFGLPNYNDIEYISIFGTI